MDRHHCYHWGSVSCPKGKGNLEQSLPKQLDYDFLKSCQASVAAISSKPLLCTARQMTIKVPPQTFKSCTVCGAFPSCSLASPQGECCSGRRWCRTAGRLRGLAVLRGQLLCGWLGDDRTSEKPSLWELYTLPGILHLRRVFSSKQCTWKINHHHIYLMP